MDIGVFFLEDGTAKKIIDYFSSGYTVPEKDKQQDWTLHTSNSKIVEEVFGESNQKQKVAVTYFSRRLNTDDTNKDRTMDGCVLFQIAANAARYGGNYALRKHVEWPDLYKACDLKKRCAGNLSDHNQENIAHWTDEKEESATEEQLINAAQNVDDTILNKTLSDTSSNFSQSIEMSSVNDVHANTTAVTKTSTLHFTQSTIPKSDEDDQSELSRNTTEISSPESVLNNNSIIQNKSQKPSLVLTLMGEFTTSETTDVSSTSETVFTVNATENIAFFTSVNDSITSVFLTNENNTIDIKNKTIDDAARVINTTIKKLATTRTALPTSTIETPITASQKIEPITTTSSAASRSLGLNTETITRSSKNKNRKSSLSKCVLSKTDLDICEEYMNNYFDQVKQWAEKHNEQMENQYGKACRLLNAVPHVPTLCCHIFREKCDAYF